MKKKGGDWAGLIETSPEQVNTRGLKDRERESERVIQIGEYLPH